MRWNWRTAGAFPPNRPRWVMLLLATVLTPIMAAPNQTPPPAPPSGEVNEVRESLQNLMIASMRKALDLTRDQQVEVIPRVEQVFEERERYARQRREALRMLQAKLLEEAVSEKDFRDQVSRLDELERSHRDLELRLRADIDRSLNPRQRAQLRVFVPRFRMEMQMRIDEARSAHPRRMEPPRPAAPPSPEEWDSDDEEF